MVRLRSNRQDVSWEPARALAEVLDVSDDLVYICDARGLCQWANYAGERFLGAGASDVIGRHIGDIFPDQSELKLRAWRRTAEGTEPFSFVASVDGQGTVSAYRLTLLPLRDQAGKLRSVVCSARGVSEEEAKHSDVQTSAAELTLIYQAAGVVASSLNLDDVSERFVSELRRLIDFDGAAIHLVEPGFRGF